MRDTMVLFGGVLLGCSLLVGCAQYRTVNYGTRLTSVDRPGRSRVKEETDSIAWRDTTEGAPTVYEDDLIRSEWSYFQGLVVLKLKNQTEDSLWVRTDQGAFVMPDGDRTPIYLDRMQSVLEEVTPIAVSGGEEVKAYLIPMENAPASALEHLVDPMFPPQRLVHSGSTTGSRTDSTATLRDVKANIGKTFSVLLPIETRDATVAYAFTFEVTGAQVEAGPESTVLNLRK